jgi:hypothetical protein
MNFDDNLAQTNHYLDIAEEAERDLAEAQTVTTAESVVSHSREDELIAHLKAEKADVRRSRAVLEKANLDGDPELIALATTHLNRRVHDFNALRARVRAELVELTTARINAHADVALRRQVFEIACDAATEAASQL